MTVFTNSRVNKEWLSMHQCIDENCPVHSLSKVKLVTGSSVTFHNVISEKRVSRTYEQNCSDNKFNEHNEINDNSTVKTPLNHTTGTLKNIKEYSNKEKETGALDVSLKTLKQQHEANVDEASLNNKRISDTDKPNFMCTLLNNNVDINKFPFYKKAVYYGNRKIVRNKFAAYSASVTNHIWTSKKGTNATRETSYISGGKDTTLVKRGIASKSHDNIFENFESALKDSCDIDISDLKVKYAFLFNPRFRTTNMAYAKGETYPYGIEIRNIWTPQSYNSISKDETMNIKNESNKCIKSLSKELSVTNNDNVQNLVCSDPYHTNLKLHPQYPQLHINSQTLVFEESRPESSLNYYNSTAIDKTVQKLAANYDYKYEQQNSGAPNTYSKLEYGSHSSNDSFSCAENSVQLPFNVTHIQYSASPDSLYSPTSDPLDKFMSYENNMPQTPMGNFYSVDGNTSPANAYLNVSPLVSSPVVSHYISPAQQLHSPAYAGQTYHFYTKWNRDPRLEAKNYGSTPDRLSDRHMHDQHNLHTPILHSFSVSLVSKKDRHINKGPPIKTSRHTARSRQSTCNERQTRKHIEDQSFGIWEDENPLGLSSHRKSDKELKKLDERMDKYQKLAGSYSSPLAASYRSHSARYSPYYVEHSRYCVSPHARYTRDRSKSRETSASNSRSSTSYRCRLSKSSPTDWHSNLLSGSSHDHRQSGKIIQDRFNRRSGCTIERKSNKSHNYIMEQSQESARCDKNYRCENKSNRKRLSETETSSKCINNSFGSIEYKEPRLSNKMIAKKRQPSRRRDDASDRLKSRSKR